MTDKRRMMRHMSEMPAVGVPDWTLGWRLKRALDWADMGAGEMADYLGYSKSQLSRFLNDKGAPPPKRVLRLWAMRCGVPYEWLQDGVTPTGPDGGHEQQVPQSRCIERTTLGQVVTLKLAS